VQVDLPEQLKATLVDHIDIVIQLSIVGDAIVHYPSVVQNSRDVDLALVYLGVDRVPVEVVQLIKVKRVAFVRDDVEEEAFVSSLWRARVGL